MTREEILALKPGPELDQLIAEAFDIPKDPECPHCAEQEWMVDQEDDTFTCHFCGFTRLMTEMPHQEFSTDIAEAWAVIEELTSHDYVKVKLSTSKFHGDYCSIIAPDKSQIPEGLTIRDTLAILGESLPHAVCLAALLAVHEYKDEEPT